DLYLIHWPAPATNLHLESWRALEHLLASGKVRAIGVSNFLPEHLQKIIDLGGTVPAINQIELHPALQQPDIAGFNAAHGIATEAWSPLAQGAVLADPAVVDIAAGHGVSPAQAILRWHLQQGRIIIPKNLDVFGFDLTADELSVIDGLERDGRTGPHPAEFNG
ncbi:MAG TPA: 2,5-diketo-D-gluconic acid reductase, partial [Arthrobacter bacterium]|nr:2,5-diketo-D-gluconic acid reductase [Arthrobacter sp.]